MTWVRKSAKVATGFGSASIPSAFLMLLTVASTQSLCEPSAL